MLDLELFISRYVTKRKQSMFLEDIRRSAQILSEKIKNKKILVIGGAGSIGSSFIRAVLPFQPASLVVVDINENGLAELTRDLRAAGEMYVPADYVTYPMDYASRTFEKMLISRKGFDIVANFSAHKHVRSEKDIYSVEALLQNNLLHARQLLELLIQYPPEEYFCVSTDKAANPVNIMGASKRIMEDLIFSYSDRFPVKTARFANVAFSNGSLPAGFLSRMEKRQPIAAPSDVKRYFVSPEESGQICMLACMLGKNREIFFPKLEEAQMVTFHAIAADLLHVSGYDIYECSSDEEAVAKAAQLKNGSRTYPVFFAPSDTSGEKAYEEFYTETEAIDWNRFSALGVIIKKAMPDSEKIRKLFEELSSMFARDSVGKEDIAAVLKSYLPNFEHMETGRSLDSKM